MADRRGGEGEGPLGAKSVRPLGGSICQEPSNPVMIEPPISAGFPSGGNYREMAVKIRELARQCRQTYGRRELLQLAAVFDRRADHFDSRLPLVNPCSSTWTTKRSSHFSIC